MLFPLEPPSSVVLPFPGACEDGEKPRAAGSACSAGDGAGAARGRPRPLLAGAGAALGAGSGSAELPASTGWERLQKAAAGTTVCLLPLSSGCFPTFPKEASSCS